MESIDISDEENESSDSDPNSHIHVTFPNIQLDSSRCHPLCSVQSLDQLSNSPARPSSNVHQVSFAFAGTAGTQVLSRFMYWEVKLQLHLKTHCEGPLCEIGVASEKALETNSVTVTPSCEKALTVHFYRSGQRLKAKTLYTNATISDVDLCKCLLKRTFYSLVGFLFDEYDGRLSAVDVMTQTILCDVKLGRKEHFYPVLAIPQLRNVAEVSLTVMKPASCSEAKQIVQLWIKNDDLALKKLEDPSPGECPDSISDDLSAKLKQGLCLNDA